MAKNNRTVEFYVQNGLPEPVAKMLVGLETLGVTFSQNRNGVTFENYMLEDFILEFGRLAVNNGLLSLNPEFFPLLTSQLGFSVVVSNEKVVWYRRGRAEWGLLDSQINNIYRLLEGDLTLDTITVPACKLLKFYYYLSVAYRPQLVFADKSGLFGDIYGSLESWGLDYDKRKHQFSFKFRKPTPA